MKVLMQRQASVVDLMNAIAARESVLIQRSDVATRCSGEREEKFATSDHFERLVFAKGEVVGVEYEDGSGTSFNVKIQHPVMDGHEQTTIYFKCKK